MKRTLISTLLLSCTALAAETPTFNGQIVFFNDECTFLLDLGIKNTGNSLGGMLSGVKCKAGAAESVKKLIPPGARIQFKVIKASVYPEGLLYFRGKDVGALLVSKRLAVRTAQ